MQKMVKFLILILFNISCHWFVDPHLPKSSFNFHEQLHEKADGLLSDLRGFDNAKYNILVAGPPLSFFEKGDFELYKANQKFLFNKAKENKKDISVVCVFPVDEKTENVLREVQDCFSQGGVGLKVYHLHTAILKKHFKEKDPLSVDIYREVFKVMEQKGKILFIQSNHNKLKKRLFEILTEFPKLNIVCTNMCFSGMNLKQLSEWMSSFPRMYLGYSFIFPKIFYNFLKNSDVEKIKQFFLKYSDRILYESGLSLVQHEMMSDRYLYWNIKNQYSFLKTKKFTFYAPPIINQARNFAGLNLSNDILDKIYFKNGRELFNSLSNSR